ncbi:histidine kinase [Pseudovibrio japonicus]|uniref:Histidine kinase n=1 Tax=Pseudovibrio japonicus TaxID=366534 RepID=A0ABQ3EFK2_9HYPH|nr:Hpt domain-containing protein [Pseudovibrio japonicus]GHB33172.1 histidine kinase [Pseudovibrio japonicus]
MAFSSSSDKPSQEHIRVPNDLSKKVRKLTAVEAAKFDPVKAAEEAVQKLSDKFESWMGTEVDSLKKANQAAQTSDFAEEGYDALFRCAHDIKGQAETLGFPLVGRVANNLTLLLVAAKEQETYPKELISQHVDAINAMISEDARDDTNQLGVTLVERLEEASEPLTQRSDS